MKLVFFIGLTLSINTTWAIDCPLRQSTASQEEVLGPFVDATDGNTPETELTIANTDIQISKAGAAMVAKNSGGATHDNLGMYLITLDATDTATVGSLKIVVAETGALIIRKNCYVFEEAVFDRDYAAASTGIVGTAQTGDSFARIGAAGAGLTALATQASVNVIDTVVDAIKAVTDQFVFTKSGEVDANAQSLNGAEVCGDGNTTAWTGNC